MKKRIGWKEIVFFVSVLIVIILIGSLLFYFIKKEDVLHTFINTVTGTTEKEDNYNGVYVYKEKLDKTYITYSGCTVKSLDTYIIVTNKQYEVYNYTCMGTYYQTKGNTTELKFSFDKTSNLYNIEYQDKIFNKDLTVREIIPNNKIEESLEKIDVSSYKFILEHTEFDGNYYDIEAKIIGADNYVLSIRPLNGGFDIRVQFQKEEGNAYTYYASSLEELPLFYTYYDRLLIVEPVKNSNGLFSYKLKMLNKGLGIEYNMDAYFPVTVNGIRLDTNNSIVVKKRENNKYFDVLIGYDNKFCEEESESEEIAYYAFKVTYDTLHLTLNQPTFDKIIYKKEGCSYYKQIMEE